MAPASLAFESLRKKAREALTAKAVLLLSLVGLSVVVLVWRTNEALPEWFDFRSAGALYPGQDDVLLSYKVREDKLLGGLLVDGFDEQQCHSRYRYMPPHRNEMRMPSDYLRERLRRQEDLQRRCGPGTVAYKNATEKLKSGNAINMDGCKYLVMITHSGLGNRIITAASAFLYALLTDRVLLVDLGQGGEELFCEPFPDTSWLLPEDFPIHYMRDFRMSHSQSYGSLLQSGAISRNASWSLMGAKPPYIFLYLDGNYGFNEKLFFCDNHQQLLQSYTWLVMRTDSYFVPGLFLMPMFRNELNKIFPEKDAIFHHLGRYLFHPSNQVWHMITWYYNTYLAKADERLGIQVRLFEGDHPFQKVMDQILACSWDKNLLPRVDAGQRNISTAGASMVRTKAVLVTSLSPDYSRKIVEMYEGSLAGGEIISVHQPSHESRQRSRSGDHNMKALAEIYLLSLCDRLVTSGSSTFGYAAQGLGGLKPWVMKSLAGPDTVPDPACSRASSIEPCFHSPSWYDCRAMKDVDVGKVLPYVRRCEDRSSGLKIFEQTG